MYVQKGKVRMPEINTGKWINSHEISTQQLKGKVVLVDFWDYTCVNCIRTLPYLREWYERYHEKGLEVVGVHAPEFTFSRTEENVRKGINEFEIRYPVVMDNHYKIWQAFDNRYWPSKYLIDKNGYFRYAHFGEGNYIETEMAIQLLIKELDPEVDLPDLMKPIRDTDIPGIHCYRVSPELFFGYKRGKLGNLEELRQDEPQEYEKPEISEEDTIYLEGRWINTSEFIEPALEDSNEAAHVYLKYTSYEVNLVINPEKDEGFKVHIMQDNKNLDAENAGDDVEFDSEGNSYVVVSDPKMYNLIKNKKVGSHLLHLSTNSDGFAVFAFTFVSCIL